MKIGFTVGLPLGGKSTWLDENRNTDFGPYSLVCPDDVRLAMGHEFYAPIEPVVWGIVETQVRALLLRGVDVVIDATNITKWERAKWVRMGKEYGAEVTAYVIKPNASLSRTRAARADRWHMMEVIVRMNNKYDPPTPNEGLEVVYVA